MTSFAKGALGLVIGAGVAGFVLTATLPAVAQSSDTTTTQPSGGQQSGSSQQGSTTQTGQHKHGHHKHQGSGGGSASQGQQ